MVSMILYVTVSIPELFDSEWNISENKPNQEIKIYGIDKITHT